MTTSLQDTDPSRRSGTLETTEDAALAGLVSRLGSDTLRYLPAVIVPAAASILGVAVFTRIFPPGPYGEYSLVYVVVTTATVILSGWLQQSLLRYLPRYRAEGKLEEFLVRFGSILWVFSGLVLAAALLLGWPLRAFLGVYARYYFVAAVWVVAGAAFSVQSHAFRANLQSAAFSRYQVAYAVGRLVLALAFVYLVSQDVMGLVIGSTAAYAVLLWPMVVELGIPRGVKSFGFSIDAALLKRLFSYGLPVMGWVLGVKVLDLSDRFIIQLFRGAEEVGIYSANYTLVTMGVLLVATPLLSAAVPLIVDAWETGHQGRIQQVISSFSRYYLITSVPVVVYTIVFSREIVTVFLGKPFREGHTIIPYILLGSFLWNFAMYGHKGIKLLEKTRVMFVLVSICCVVNVVLNLIIVPRYGYQGAAVTTFISYALYPVMLYFVSRSYIAWVIPWRSVLNITLSGLAGALAGWGVKIGLAGKVHVLVVLTIGLVAGSVAYMGALAVVRELREHELRLIGLKGRAR
jgi:O-antigen/teichoic acid export membrane protein